jgi:PAS domain S-box-containing protein
MDALLVVGLDGTVNDINEAVVNLTGKARDEILGARFESFFDSPEQARRGVELALSDGSVRNYELVVIASSGERIPVSFNASSYRDSDGTLQGIFAIARDLRP